MLVAVAGQGHQPLATFDEPTNRQD